MYSILYLSRPSMYSNRALSVRQYRTCLDRFLAPLPSVWAGTVTASRLYLLGRAVPLAVGPADWVRQHRLRLQDAPRARALKHLQQAVTERVKQMDQRASDHPLNVGVLVYMKKPGRRREQNTRPMAS